MWDVCVPEVADLIAIDVRGVRKVFGSGDGQVTALDKVSVAIRENEFFTLLGPSGCGKTTLLRLIAGFEFPTEGEILLYGEDIAPLPPFKRPVNTVFQSYALFPHMTVAENIGFGLEMLGKSRAEIDARIAQMLGLVQMEELAKRKTSEISGGQQQRVALARALAPQPKVLLLDEPLSALDKNLREQMRNEIKQLHQKTGATFVFVTHDQTEALALSTRLAIFDHGRLQQVGRPDVVYERPVSRFVAEFLGRINLLPLRDARHDGGLLRGRFEDCAVAALADGTVAANGAIVAVRPEHMTLSGGQPEADGWNAIPATLANRLYVGATSLLQLHTRGGVELSLEVRSADLHGNAELGSQLWVKWPIERGFALPGTGMR